MNDNAFSVTDDLFSCHLWWKNKINQENVNPAVTVWKLIDWQQLLLQDPGWMSSSVSLSIDVWVMPVVCPCFRPVGMSESEQFLKGTSQIKTLYPEDIEGMRVVCKVAISIDSLLSRRAFLAYLLLQCDFDMCAICSWQEKFWTLQPWWWNQALQQKKLTTPYIWCVVLKQDTMPHFWIH